MNIESLINHDREATETASLAETMSRIEEKCRNCKPLSMLECVTNCNAWKLKNEFRKLDKKMQDPNFMTQLFNVLKNKRRLQILEIIAKGQYSIQRLQQELGKLGYHHSQRTIAEEYIAPLTEVGLAHETQDKYYATLLGCKLSEISKGSLETVDLLPPHSECYEELALTTLREEPKTYEDLKEVIPLGNIARVLNRLQMGGLIETNKEKDYVFFFKTQRNPNKEVFSPTEKKVYENISEDGISARKLAEKSKISLRRTYKYLRRLKGKKLVFAREKPRFYALTAKSLQMATMLQQIRNLVGEARKTAECLVREEEGDKSLTPNIAQAKLEKKRKSVIPLTTVQYVRSN
jgi:predicted transcriptional regulator